MSVLSRFREDRVVAVVRAPAVADPGGLAATLAARGVRGVEFTFTIDGVLDAIEAAADTDAVVGAGTVTTAGQAADAVAAGAQFVVCPVLAPEVRDAVDVPVVLAGLTPTELHRAEAVGADAVKLFPARLGGPGYLADVLGPLPDLPVLPSGGVDETNAADYLRAGAVAVFAGSSVVAPDAAEAADHDRVSAAADRIVRAVA